MSTKTAVSLTLLIAKSDIIEFVKSTFFPHLNTVHTDIINPHLHKKGVRGGEVG
jgi:hypothetical protein